MPEEEISEPTDVEADPPTGESADAEETVSAEESAGGRAGSDSAVTDASVETVAASAAKPVIDSPPPAARPLKESDAEPRMRLHQLAAELVRNRNRRLLVEFLQLRRALR